MFGLGFCPLKIRLHCFYRDMENTLGCNCFASREIKRKKLRNTWAKQTKAVTFAHLKKKSYFRKIKLWKKGYFRKHFLLHYEQNVQYVLHSELCFPFMRSKVVCLHHAFSGFSSDFSFIRSLNPNFSSGSLAISCLSKKEENNKNHFREHSL